MSRLWKKTRKGKWVLDPNSHSFQVFHPRVVRIDPAVAKAHDELVQQFLKVHPPVTALPWKMCDYRQCHYRTRGRYCQHHQFKGHAHDSRRD
jgi:hypothetical protein